MWTSPVRINDYAAVSAITRPTLRSRTPQRHHHWLWRTPRCKASPPSAGVEMHTYSVSTGHRTSTPYIGMLQPTEEERSRPVSPGSVTSPGAQVGIAAGCMIAGARSPATTRSMRLSARQHLWSTGQDCLNATLGRCSRHSKAKLRCSDGWKLQDIHPGDQRSREYYHRKLLPRKWGGTHEAEPALAPHQRIAREKLPPTIMLFGVSNPGDLSSTVHRVWRSRSTLVLHARHRGCDASRY